MQAASRPLAHDYTAASGDRRHEQIVNEGVWSTAVHRVVTEGITPEQAVDEAIVRIKEILGGVGGHVPAPASPGRARCSECDRRARACASGLLSLTHAMGHSHGHLTFLGES